MIALEESPLPAPPVTKKACCFCRVASQVQSRTKLKDRVMIVEVEGIELVRFHMGCAESFHEAAEYHHAQRERNLRTR